MSYCLRAENLSKRYRYYKRPTDRIWEWLTLGALQRYEPRWALHALSFEIQPGEAVGIVGANGAGKSTLLKLLRGSVRATEGRVEHDGRIAAIELGLGFHPDFTGRQNLYTAGALLGHDTAQVRELENGIELFAEIGAYMDEPVRTYSTGMQMRLAFSLATAVRPDILLIDEALAVGDAYFSQKCTARIRQFRERGTALVLVSHDPGSVKTLCDRAILLDKGVMVREGNPARILEYYNAMIAKQAADHEIFEAEALVTSGGTTRSGDRRSLIESVELFDSNGPARAFQVGGPMRIHIEGTAREVLDDLTVGISIRDRLGNEIFGINTYHLGVSCPHIEPQQKLRAEFEIPVNLGYGNYSVTVSLHAGADHLEGNYDWWDNVLTFQVVPGTEPYFVGTSFVPSSVSLDVVS